MSATVVASAKDVNAGTNQITFGLPSGIQAGDLLVVAYLAASSSAYITDFSAKGWWSIDGIDVNTRAWALYARIYNPADASTVYTLSMNAASNAKWLSLAIRDHDVSVKEDILVGARWRRQDNGGSQGKIIAPSITTTKSDELCLAFTGEATATAGSYTVTTASGFTLVDEIQEIPSGAIEWITAWDKNQVSAGDTGLLEINYGSTVSINGVGLQIAIPSGVTQGVLGAHLASAPAHDSITIGTSLKSGTTLEAVLKQGGVEVARKTVVVDIPSTWGNVVFDGLSSDTLYTVDFVIDGTEVVNSMMSIRTLPTPGQAKSFTVVTGSCQFTGSNHPVWDAIAADNPLILAHMGDLHYDDATTVANWRSGVEASLSAEKFRSLLSETFFTWTWDNHDRIIVDDGGAGTPLNLGRTDPLTNTEWRRLAGAAGWGSSDSAGRTFVVGRVRFIQTDNWTMKDDPDSGTATPPLTFLGDAQKQWFKDTLETATEEVIVWLCQWTGQNHANGRWNSFPEETSELEAWIDARPEIKRRMVMIGGDSHSLQVTDGTRTAADGQRFPGIPNYNISGFNRTSDGIQGGPGWLDDRALRTSAQPETDWGGYSRVTVTDNGSILEFKWEGVRVGPTGTTDVMNTQILTFEAPKSQPWEAVYVDGQLASAVYDGSTKVWP